MKSSSAVPATTAHNQRGTRNKKRRRAAARRVFFEPLEPRMMLVADMLFEGTGSDDQIVVRDAATPGMITIESANGTFATQTFETPTNSLRIDGVGGDDIVTIHTLSLGSAKLDVSAERIVVSANAVVSSAGDITLTAKEFGIADLDGLLPINVDTKTATITVGQGARILGRNIVLKAQAEDKTAAEVFNISSNLNNFVIAPLKDQATDLTALPVKAMFKKSLATVTVDANTQLIGSAGVSVDAIATANATGKAISSIFTIGYADARAEARVDIGAGARIDAGEAVKIGSEGNVFASITTRTKRELGSFPADPTEISLSIGVANTTLVSRTTVAEGARITAGKTANIIADGNSDTEASIESGSYADGRAGLSFGIGLSNSDINTEVNGLVTANLLPGSVVKIEFDPTTTDPSSVGFVDDARNAIHVGPHALATGDKVSYSNRRGASIGGVGVGQLTGGLVDGQEYFVIAMSDDPATPNFDESHLIQLAQTETAAFAGNELDLSGGAATNSKSFDPRTAVSGDDDTITLANPAAQGSGLNFSLFGSTFELGQAVIYRAGAGQTPIGGLKEGGQYYVVVSTDQFNLNGDLRFVKQQVIQLAETENKARAGIFLKLDPTVATGTEHSLTALHVLDSGLTTGVGVQANLNSNQSVASTAGISDAPAPPTSTAGDMPTSAKPQTLFDRLVMNLSKGYSEDASKADSGAGSSLQGAGALSYVKVDNQVHADVGSTARLQSKEDLEVAATINNEHQLNAETSVEPNEDASSSAISAAVIVGLLDNTAEAIVHSKARLDGFKATRVISDVTYPYLARPDEFIPGSVGELVDLLKSGSSSARSTKDDAYDNVNDYLDGTLGLKSKLFNTWARSTAKADKLSVAGSVNYLDYDNVSRAVIEAGAQINQDAAFLAGGVDASLSIEATTYMQVFNVTGVFDFKLPSGSITPGHREFDGSTSISPVGSGSGKGGVGGAIFLMFVDNDTKALVENDAKVFTGSAGGFNMKAEEAMLNFNFSQAGASAGKYAIGGTVSYVEQNSSTLAKLAGGAQVTGGTNVNETDVAGSPITIYAGSLETVINWAGAVAKAGSLGFGITVAINDIDRDTQAIIGNIDPVIDPNSGAAPSTTTNINASGDIKVDAKNDGALWAFSFAAAVAGGSPPPDSSEKGETPVGDPQDGKKAQYGIGISANVAINTVDDNARAYIHDAGTIAAPHVTVVGANKTDLFVLAAAASVLLPGESSGAGGNSGSAAIAGSFSKNKLTGATAGFIKGQNTTANKKLLLAPARQLSINADRASSIQAFTAGFGVSVNRPGNSLIVAGSVALNEITNSSVASWSGIQDDANPANPNAGADKYSLLVDAQDKSSIFALAGVLAIGLGGGNLGVGFSYAANTINSDTDAGLDNVHLVHVDKQTVSAMNQAEIRALTITGSLAAGTGNQIALSGSLSTNTINAGAVAFVSNSRIVAAGDATLTATDASSIQADGGGVAIAAGKAKEGVAGGSGGLGISLGFNTIANPTHASIDNATVDAASIRVLAEARSARTKTYDFTAIDSTNESITLADHGLDTGDQVTYHDLSGAGQTVGGLQVERSYYVIKIDDNTIKLAETRGDANIFRPVDLSGTTGTSHRLEYRRPTIEALSIAGAGGGAVGTGTTGAFAAAGAGAENKVSSHVEAFIVNSGNANRVHARAGDVVVTALDAAIIDVDVIGASLAVAASNGSNAGALAVGVSISRNEINNRIQAYLDKSTVVASGDIGVTVMESATITALSVAASLSVGASSSNALSLSGGGAETSNVILTKANAYVEDSVLPATNVDVTVSNTSQIESKVIAASLSVGLGSSNAGAASIGAARARNFIGWKLDGTASPAESQAYVMNSSITASGDLVVRSIADQDIQATAIAGSAAVSAAGSNALGLSGAGVDVNNKIRVLNNAFLDGDGAAGIVANTITVSVDDSSSISAVGVGASLAIAAAGNAAGALSIGVSLARNEVDNDVQAYIANADQLSSRAGDVDVSATSRGKKLFDLDATGAQLVSSAELDDLATTFEDDKDTPANEQEQDTANDAAIFAKLRAQFMSKGHTLSGDLRLTGIDDGSSWSLVDSGDNKQAYLITKQADDRLEVTYTTIKAIAVAASVAAGFGGTGGAGLSGAGADAKNVIATDTNAFITDSVITASGDVDLDATSTQSMIATIIAASLGVGAGGTGGIGASIGAAFAENFIGFNQAGGTDANQAAEVRAYIVDSSINAGDDLSATAIANQGILAVVFAGSAAIAGGGTGAVGLAGSGVSAKNKIGAVVEAAITGDGATGSLADSVTLVARDTSNIKADAGAASLAASFAGVGALSLSIGVALASNEISNQVAAFIDGADNTLRARTGNVKLEATEAASIRSRTAAAAASIAVSGVAGIAIAGAGASASNVILGGVNAYIKDSRVISDGAITANAVNLSTINAQVISAAASLAVGAAGGLAASIGASFAMNSIGFNSSGMKTPLQVRAYADNSTLDAVGAITFDALTQERITATTFAGSVAIAGGLGAGAGAGSGVNTTNKIANDVQAFMRGDQTSVTGSAVTLLARDRSDIAANANAASIAVAIGVGGAVSIAVTLAENLIENDVRAFHEGGTMTARTGDVEIRAVSTPTIDSIARAGGVAGGIGVGAAAGVDVKNKIGGSTSALVRSGRVTANAGELKVTSESTARPRVHGSGLAAALGIGAAVGAVLTESSASGMTEAGVGGTINVNSLTVTATGTSEARATSNAVTGGIVGVGVNQASASVTPSVSASIGDQANITVSGNATITAVGSAFAESQSMGVTVGALNVGLSMADLTLKPTVYTNIGKQSKLAADGKVTISSDLTKNEGRVTTTASGGGLAGVSGAVSKQTVVADVATAISDGTSVLGATGLDVLSKSTVNLNDISKVEIGGGVSLQKAEAKETVNTAARTTLSAASSLASPRGMVNVNSNNKVEIKSEAKTRFYGLGSGAIAEANTRVTGLGNAKLAETVLGAGSSITGFKVNVGANIERLAVDSDADGQQFAVGGAVDTISKIDVDAAASVVQHSGATIAGDHVMVLAQQLTIDVNGLGDQSKGLGAAPVHDGDIVTDLDLRSEVIIHENAEIAGNTIEVKAKGARGNVVNDKNNDAIGIPVSKVDLRMLVDTDAVVDVAGRLLPGTNAAVLFIDASGKVAFNQSFDGPNLAVGTTIAGPDITINGLRSAQTPSLTITAERSQINVSSNENGIALGAMGDDQRNKQGEKVTIQTTASYVVPDRFSAVTIDNRSSKHLDINGLDVLLPTTAVTPVISPAATLTNNGVRKLTGVEVEINSTSDTAVANIFLDGAINNPTGLTAIRTVAGSILDRTADAASRITTSTLDLSGGLNIGAPGMPIQADTSQEASVLPAPTLKAIAGGSVDIALAATTPPQALKVLGIAGVTGNVTLDFASQPVSIAGTILSSDAGAIVINNVGEINDNNDNGRDISGGSLLVQGSTGNLGATTNPLETSLSNVESTTTGGIFLDNNRALTIGSVSPLVGLNAGSTISVITNTFLAVDENVQAAGDIRLTVRDEIHPTENQVALADNVQVTSISGNIALLSGDSMTLRPGHMLNANGGAGEVVIGIDWGNADPGVGGTFTVPNKAAAVFNAATLRIVGDSDSDVLTIPELYMPIIFEGRGGADAVDAKLLEAPSPQTRLVNIDIETIDFEHVATQATTWLLDTEPSTQSIPLFERPDGTLNVAHLTSGANHIVQNMHSLDASFASLDVNYVFGDGVDTLTVLAMRHPATLELRGGNDVVTVGGTRGTGETTVPIDPGFILRPLTLRGGSGQDTFVLVEPRTGNNVVPIGRIGSTDDGRGLIQDYGSREVAMSPRRIEFAEFEQTAVDLGGTASIFTVLDTVIPTTINAGAGDDVVTIRKLSSPTNVNLEAGNDTLNILGGGALLTVDGGTLQESSPNLPDGGDRVLLGATRSFDSTVVNVADGKNAVKLLGTGWERGQQVLFTSDGTAPTGLTSGKIYYVVSSGRDIIRLAETRDKALAASPTNENDPNIIVLGNGGAGEHHLTLTTDGKPLWPRMIASLTGSDASPLLSVAQPAAERKITALDPATNRLTSESNLGFANGQQVAVFSDGALPGGLRSEKFYFVINQDATSFQLSETAGGTAFDLTAAAGTGSHFVAPVGTAGFTNFEKVNVLLGLGNDTFIADSTIQTLNVEVRGGPGNDEFVLFNVPGQATVISGGSGAQDRVRVLVPGDPQPDQFTSLTIGAGIENLAIDNSSNANAVHWIVSQGSLYFISGEAGITAQANTDTFAFSVAEFDITRGTTPPLANGDLVLVSSSGSLPTYTRPPSGGTPAVTVPLDATQFYAVREIGTGSFKLSLPGVNAALNLDTSGTDALFFQRVSALVGLEGAKNSELLAGGDNTATLSVVTPLDATVDVNANQLRIIEGARALDHESNLSRGSFPVDRVDGLQGVRSVVTTSSHFVFAAGTAEHKIAMFVRQVDPADATKSLLTFVKAIDSPTGHVPNDPSVLKLSPDERFLYAIGSSYLSVFAVSNVNGKPDLQWVQDVLGTGDGRVISYSPATPNGTLLAQSVNLSLTLENPTDLEFSRSLDLFGNDTDQGTRVYMTDAGTQDGIVVFRRDVVTGLLTEVVQKLTKENSFGKSVDVGNSPSNRPNVAALSDGNLMVLDEPFTQPINGRGTYSFYAWNASTITPVLLKPLTEDDHTDPDSWDSWEIVATGETRTITAAGVHEFEFGLTSGMVVNQPGLYFGWVDGGVGELSAVLLTPETSSNAFQIRDTELTSGIQAGSRSNSAQYRAGFAFSMDANFEVEVVKGLEEPQTIAISPDGSKLFTGDRVGHIATWDRQSDGTFRVLAHEAWYPEGSVAGGPGYGRAVDLSHDTNRGLRLSELSAYISLANAGQTIFGADSANRWIAAFDTTTNNLRYAPVLLPQSTLGLRGPDANTLFDIDADPASVATNGNFLLVGAPGSDRIRPFDVNDQGDDVGAVLSYRINPDQSLTLHQVFSWTSDLAFFGSKFGSNLAMDGHRAAIPFVDNLGNSFVQIVEYDPASDAWSAQATLSGGFLVDIDRDTLVTSAMGVSGPGVQFYQRISGVWTPKGFFNLNPIAVTVDGNTASITVEGAVHILRQNEAGEWITIQQLSSPASSSYQTSISENATAPLYSSATLVSFFIQAGTESDGNGREELYITLGFNNTTDPVIFNTGFIGFNERETHSIGRFASFNGSLVYSFWEFDANSSDEFFGRIRFNENGSIEKQTSINGQFVPCDSPVLCNLKDTWEVRVAVSSQSIPDSDTIDVPSELADSLGDWIAAGLPSQNTVVQFAESKRQAGWSAGNGRVTDIAVSPDGSTLYATDVTGTVYVLFQETPPVPQNPNTLRLDQLQPPFTAPTVANLDGASSIAISADGVKVYVTAETSGAVTVFDRGGLLSPNVLGNRTLLTNSGDNLTGVADSASESPFTVQGGLQQFLVTASAGSSTLATFEFNGVQFIASQGNNPDGRNGLGDGNPLDSVTRVQSLAMNPMDSAVAGVKQVFYAAAPFEDTIFVFNRAADGTTKVAQRLKDDRTGSSGQVDLDLAGAADIAVSPDGRFMYVAAVEEGSMGMISVYERATLMDSDGIPFDGLRYVSSAATSVLGAAGDSDVITLRASPDGKNIYASGASGLQVFDRDANDGSLTTSFETLAFTVSDIKFPTETRAYAVEPFTNKLLVFDRAANGALTKADELDTRLDDPRSVEIGDVIDGQNFVGQRFVYVASAGTNSISVLDEFSSDGSDKAIDGKLRHVHMVREGVNGVRGLSGVSVLQLSAYVNDSTLEFAASELDLATWTINMKLPHGLRTEQLVWFTASADAPGGVQTQESALYYARRIDKDRFQLFTTPEGARLGDESELVKFTAGDGSYALHTEIPAGAFLYALGTDANAIVVFEREFDAASPNLGQLTFLQVIRNRVGNATGGANNGLFRPDSIIASSRDPTTVFVSSSFDPLLIAAPGGFVTLHNNASDSPSLPPVETRLTFTNVGALTITTGSGSDVITVNKAPTNGMGTAAVAIPLDVSTGRGADSFTLNDAGDQVLTSADLGAGDDVFTLRTQRDAAGADIQVRAGDGTDSILVKEVAARSAVMIWTEGATDDPHNIWSDTVRVAARGIHQSGNVTVETGAADGDLFSYEIEGDEEDSQFTNGNNANGNQLQLDWSNENSIFGSVFARVGSNHALPTERQFVRSDSAPVASIVDPGAIAQGSSVTFESNSSLPVIVQTANVTVRTAYAWDLNGDGLFTEYVTEDPAATFAWEDLVDFGFAAKGGGDYRVPLRVTRTFTAFDPANDPEPRITQVQQSDSEVLVTVTDRPPVAVVNDGQAEANHVVRLGGAPFSLNLAADGNDPTNDAIVQWTVKWVEGEPGETIDSQRVATHFYQRPGRYQIDVTGLDENNKQTQQVTTAVNVTFDASSLDPGGAYTIDEGQGVELRGVAAGTPDSVRWFIDGKDAGAGTLQPFSAPTQSVTATLLVTWPELQALGVTNDGSFDVQLKAMYAGTANPIESAVAKLEVANIAPTAIFVNSGPINQGQTATVGFVNVVEPHDELTYSYDFGKGYEPGSATQAVPVTLGPGTHVISARLNDGTATQEFTTTLVINDLPPELAINANESRLIEVPEGDTATVQGTFHNPGGGAVVFSASIGAVTHDATAGTWNWILATTDNAVLQGVTITVTDTENASDQVSFDLLVSNVPPHAVFEVPSGVKEGDTGVTVRLTQVTDPSSVDTAAGFSYFYDFGDGNGFIAGSATQAVPAALLADSGDTTVRARIVDEDGGVTELTNTLTVANTIATINTLTISPRQISSVNPVTVTGTFGGDAGVNDTHTVEINWGDGRIDRLSATNVLGITARGSGYADALDVAVTGGSGTGRTVDIATENGAVIDVVVKNPGTGYQTGDVLTVNRGTAVGDAKITLGAFNQAAGTFTAVHAYAVGGTSLPNPTIIKVTVSDDDGGQGVRTLSAVIVGAPTITTTSAITVEDQQTFVIDVQASDPDGETEGNGLTYQLSGGADQDRFSITAATGVLTFKSAPLASSPTDVGQDNVYNLRVTVTDTTGLTDVQDIAVTVVPANVNKAPTIATAASVSVAENQTAVFDVESLDPDGETEGAGLTYSLTGGADRDLFSLNTNTGVLTFKTAPNFENPRDSGANNVYDVQVTVTDAGGLTGVQNLAVTVINVNEAPSITSPATVSVAENQAAVINVESLDPDGETEGAGLTYSLTGGADQDQFSIVAATGVLTFIASPDFESPQDADADNVYEVQVTVRDAGALIGLQNLVVTVTDVDEGSPRITLDKLNVKENLTGLVIGQLAVADEDPVNSLLLSVEDPRFEIVDRTLKLKDRTSLQLTDGTTVTVEITARSSGDPALELVESFVLKVLAHPRPWQYLERPLDSNADGSVVPLDALLIINELNEPTILEANGKLPVTRDASSTLPYYDVNGDGFCTASDVLQIINFLNAPQGEGEARVATERLTSSPRKLVWSSLPPAVSENGILSVRDDGPFDDAALLLICGELRRSHTSNRATAVEIQATPVADRDFWEELLDQLAEDIAYAWWNPAITAGLLPPRLPGHHN